MSLVLLSIFFLWHFICKTRLSFLSELTTNQLGMLLIFLWLCQSIEWSSLYEKREHMGLVTLCTPTIELLWHWRWSKKLEVALKHGITVLPFFFFFVFSELPGVHRACNFLFSESPIFLRLQALCPTACDSVLTNRYCPVGRMVAGTKELLSGFYSNPGSEIYEWTFRIVMWITSARREGSEAR